MSMISKRAILAMSSVTEGRVAKIEQTFLPAPEDRSRDVVGVVPEGDLRFLKTVILEKIAELEEMLEIQHPTEEELHKGINLSREISQMNDLFWLELGALYSQVQNSKNLRRTIFQGWKIVCDQS